MVEAPVTTPAARTSQPGPRSPAAAAPPVEDAPSPAVALPPGVTDADADDVREATFRHMFKKNASGQKQTAHVFCIDLENDTSAPAAFVARFRDVKIPVKPGSACNASTPLGVVDRSNGAQGLQFRIDGITFADAEHARVEGGYYEASLSASGNTYTLEKKNGKWIVTKDVMHWIS